MLPPEPTGSRAKVRYGAGGRCCPYLPPTPETAALLVPRNRKPRNESGAMNYWLMKSEPGEFSINDLQGMPDQTEHWDGVRNYQARNRLRDEIKIGDLVFCYHSNCLEPGIAGIMEVCREGYPDFTAFDPQDKHYDPKSRKDNPRWFMVNVRFVRKLKRVISLKELKACPQLKDFALVRRGNRLSIMPVTEEQWQFILSLE